MKVKELGSQTVISFICILLQKNSNLGLLYCRALLNLYEGSPKDHLDGGIRPSQSLLSFPVSGTAGVSYVCIKTKW